MSLRVTVIFLATLLFATSCKKEDVNLPPSKPKLLAPAQGAVVAPESITFVWEESIDPDDEKVEYNLVLSSDSTNWQHISVGYGVSKTIANKQGNVNFYPFEIGKKYFWKLSIDSRDGSGQLTSTIESDVVRFYTVPSGVANLSKTSGDGFVNLNWTDPAGLSKVEVTFSPAVAGITQPITVNSGVGKVDLSGFANSTIYSFYVKAYNSLGHISKPDTIKAMPLLPTLVHDADFNIYSTIQIGTQTWMAQNLRTTKWQDGKIMLGDFGLMYYVSPQSELHGNYYRVSVLDENAEGKNPCPCGYHIPSDDDWKTLERYLGMSESDINKDQGYRGEDAEVGYKLKSTTGWVSCNGVGGNGSDLYNFNLLPSGWCTILGSENGELREVGESTVLAVSTKLNGDWGERVFSNGYKGVARYFVIWGNPSIRCVKD